MSTVTIELIGLQPSLAGFTRLEDKLTRLKPLWDRFEQEFHSQERVLFDRQPWKPLSPAYAERKRRLVGDKPILRFTDRLFQSLTEHGAEGHIHRVSDDGAEFGSTVPYGVFHESTRNPMAEPDEDRYNTIAAEYVAEQVKESGFE